MDAFDPKEYERQVVRPLRGRSGGRLPDDLTARYALRLDLSDADVARRVGEVRSHWHKSAGSSAKSPHLQSVYKAFLRADEELRQQHGDEMLRSSWWRARDAARCRDRGQRTGELVEVLRKDFGELGLITSGQLDVLREHFGRLAPDEVDQALEAAGVRLSEPVELPRASGLPETLYRRLRSLLADAGTAGVAELVHGELDELRLLTEFRSRPQHPAGLTAEAIAQAVRREDRRSGNQAAREALGILQTAAGSNGVDLRELALFHLLDDVRRHRGNHAPTSVLLRVLRAAKLGEDEARLALVSVLAETGVPEPGPTTGRAEVAALLADGRLIAAERALPGIADADEAKAAQELVDRRRREVRQDRDAAHRALAGGDEARALRHLRQAARLAADDEAIEAELRRTPPPPVLDVAAQPEGFGVRVSWRAPAGHDEGTRYRLVRRTGHSPADPEHGELVAEGPAVVAVDSAAPAGIQVHYAVFAATGEGPWSRPAAARIEVLPPVRDVRLKHDDGSIEVTWEVHPDVVGVDVHRDDGAGGVPIATGGATSFRDTAVDPASSATYLLLARYRGPGGEGVSEPVRVEASRVVRTLQPVTGLEYRRFGAELVLSWSWPEDAGVAEVTWTGEKSSDSRRLSRQEYQDSGGFRFRAGADRVRVQVSVLADDGAVSSPAAELEVAPPAPRILYTVRRRTFPLLRGRTARITLTADRALPECAVLVVAAPGPGLPTRPGDGRIIHRLAEDLRAGVPVEATVQLPKLRRPYWLRCFADAPGVRIVDPSTAQLKVT